MNSDHFTPAQHKEYGLIIQTCQYRLEAFFRALKGTYGDDHQAVRAAAQVLKDCQRLAERMDHLVITEYPDRNVTAIYRTDESPRASIDDDGQP